MTLTLWRWIDRNILELGRELRLSYLPPLMVYMAAGISSLTGIVGTFFVKDYLNLSVAFLAALSFWIVIPWSLKMVLGHLIDLLWRWKRALLFLGASLIAASLLIMVGLIGSREAMAAFMPVESWYVLSALLAPIGYVLQDAVADAMTVEAVPRVDEAGQPIDPERRKLMHTTMQTLGRVAIIGGSVFVAVINLYVFAGVQQLDEAQKVEKYLQVYLISMSIPLISVLGVILASILQARAHKKLLARGMTAEHAHTLLSGDIEVTKPNWMILGGSLVFVVFTMTMGLTQVPYGQEIIFLGSMAIVTFLIVRLTRDLDPQARSTLVGTAIVIFVFRAIPSPGPGVTWWMIDDLKFDQHFFSMLSLIAGTLSLLGMFIFRRFMAERSIAYVVGTLTLFGTVLSLPTLGMYYGLHQWTSAMTGGVVDARFIALVDAALESPLGQVAMIPMLAWIARSAPENLKATYFAVMASFTNLALSLSQLGTKYLNQIFTVTREVRNPATGIVEVAANYSSLGSMLTISILIGLSLPFLAIAFVKLTRLRTA
ncbi:fbt, folate/biopterin transporter [Burkholderiaceae bacterium]